jgi:hypothetical protein
MADGRSGKILVLREQWNRDDYQRGKKKGHTQTR